MKWTKTNVASVGKTYRRGTGVVTILGGGGRPLVTSKRDNSRQKGKLEVLCLDVGETLTRD